MTASSSTTLESRVILPGSMLGVFGNGQLGRMFALAAAEMGYRVHVFGPHENSPTGQVAAYQTVADYDDLDAVRRFAESVDVVTLEFENVSKAATDEAAKYCPVHPSSQVLHITQDRIREKRFLESIGVACTKFATVSSAEELQQAVEAIGVPAVLKTTGWGYDGKGQRKVVSAESASECWEQIDRQPAIYEGWVDYQQELSVIVSRSSTGQTLSYPAIANDHVNHILDTSVCPAPELAEIGRQAQQLAEQVCESLGAVGVIGVEFFLTSAGELLVNEIAPRPHNTGHLTIDACDCSQFEQQVRAICGLPLGSTELVRPAAMANLLGDRWVDGEPSWTSVLESPEIRLHLYGKETASLGRKMGHLTALAESPKHALQLVRAARDGLR